MNEDSCIPQLVPELLVAYLPTSLDFWCSICGFSVHYDRKDERFAYLVRGGAHVMLEQRGISRNWIPAALEPPYGRGINFEIRVEDITPMVERLTVRGWPLFMNPEEKSYRTSEGEVRVRQFLVQDPDGYLLRFSERVADRPTSLGG